jgi:Flp pilus assembly pilin Flp
MYETLRAFIDSANLPEPLVRFIEEQEGQSTVEYLLLISVIIVAIVAAAYVFLPTFKAGVKDLAGDVSTMLSDGNIGSTGTGRSGGS